MPKTAEDLPKPEVQWLMMRGGWSIKTNALKASLYQCLPYDIMESVINCETAKYTWTDLVQSFEGPSEI